MQRTSCSVLHSAPDTNLIRFRHFRRASNWLRCARLLQQACARSPTLCARGYVLLIFSSWVYGRDCPATCACLYNAHKGWQPQEQAKEGLVSKKSWNKRLNQCVTCFRCCYVEYTPLSPILPLCCVFQAVTEPLPCFAMYNVAHIIFALQKTPKQATICVSQRFPFVSNLLRVRTHISNKFLSFLPLLTLLQACL